MVTAICIIIGTIIGTVIGHYIGKMIWKFLILLKIRKIEKVHLPKSLLDRLEKPSDKEQYSALSLGFYAVGSLPISEGIELLISKYLDDTIVNERKYRIDLLNVYSWFNVGTEVFEDEFWKDEDLKEHIAELVKKYNEKRSSSINSTDLVQSSRSTIQRTITMNETIQKINSIIDNFDKAYGEWMDKKDHSLEEEMEIFKKAYNEFCDLYTEDNVTDTLIDLIVDWIRDTVGEMYLDWNTEVQDYYDPGLTLKDFVEKYTKGE